MDILQNVSDEIHRALYIKSLRKGLSRSVNRLVPAPYRILDRWRYLLEYTEELREAKEKVLQDIDYYIDLTMKRVEETRGHAYYAKTRDEAVKLVNDLVGEDKLIVKSKSMVTEELRLREELAKNGNTVYETDLGELLIQFSRDKPMHTTAPAIHITREKAIRILRKHGVEVRDDMSTTEIVGMVRIFLREKFVEADIGISGANSIAADTGSIFLVSNEGNIRNTTSLPPMHIAITGVEKIMPSMDLAFKQTITQAAYAGLYPPTYVSVISGPSSTADIEFERVYGVHGPKEVHVILYDGGRIEMLKNEVISEQLYCIRCGRCQAECPIWQLVGNIWGGNVYGGPMGMGWTAIVEGIEKAASLSHFCLLCGKCREVCPMKIDMPRIIRYLKTYYFKYVRKG